MRLPSWLLVLLGYLGLGIALTWPLVLRFSSDLPGGAHKDGLEDAYQNVWNLWWTVEALSRPTNLWVTDLLFYPDGPNLLFHTLSPGNTLAVAPITALWGPIAGFNALALASFALGGLGMWLLARRYCGPAPALLAGIVYVASPFHIAALVSDGQLQIFSHQWLPWYLHFLLLSIERPAERWRRNAFWAGVFLSLTAWGDWYYTLFLLIFSALVLLWQLGRQGVAQIRTMVAPLLLMAGVFALSTGPLIVAMLSEAARSNYVSILPPDDPARLSADLLAYVVPQRLHPLWGAAPWDWGVDYGVNRRFYLGLSLLLLALLALWKRPAARPWGLAAGCFLVLSLGPSLRINGQDSGVPLPYQLIAELPIVSLTRQPDRFNVLVTIALGMLAAYAAAWLLQHWRARPALLIALLAALILVEYWPAPIVTRTPPVPAFYATLPAGPGALLEYPFHPEITYRDAERMRFQSIHGRPISGGYHSRAYPQPQLGLPVLRDLQAGQLASDIVLEAGGWPAALQTLGYSYIVGYKQQPLGPINLQPADEAPFRALVEAGLGVAAPLSEDDWLIVYAVPPAEGLPLVQLRNGWGPIEQPTATTRYRWLPEAAALGLIGAQAGPHRFSFSALPAGGPRTLALEFPAASVQLPLAPELRRYHLLVPLANGSNLTQMRSLEPPTSGEQLYGNGDLRPISVRIERIGLTLLQGGE